LPSVVPKLPLKKHIYSEGGDEMTNQSLVVVFENGVDENGEKSYFQRTFNDIHESATPQALRAVAQAFGSLFGKSVTKVQLVERNVL
jgi:hypothetical protein